MLVIVNMPNLCATYSNYRRLIVIFILYKMWLISF